MAQVGSNFGWQVWASRLRNVEVVLLAAGLSLCLAAAVGLTGPLCLTRGCELYQDFAVLGLSMHLWGALAFGGALVVKLLGLSFYRPYILACLWGGDYPAGLAGAVSAVQRVPARWPDLGGGSLAGGAGTGNPRGLGRSLGHIPGCHPAGVGGAVAPVWPARCGHEDILQPWL